MFKQSYCYTLAFIICFFCNACSLPATARVASALSHVPSPVQTALPAITPPPTVILSQKPIATPVVIKSAIVASTTGLTAPEFYNLALAEAQKWQSDAGLVRMDSGALTLLNIEGKSANWTAEFWSSSNQKRFTLTLINKAIITQTAPASPPDALLAVNFLDLELTHFLKKAAAAGGKAYLDKGYGMVAGMRPDDLSPARPVWTIIYLKADKLQAAFTVTVDAHTGQVLHVY